MPNDDLLERARQIHTRTPVILIHDHVPLPADVDDCLAGGICGKVHLPILDIQIGPDAMATGRVTEGWARHALEQFGQSFRQIEADPRLKLATTAADFERARQQRRLAVLLGSEGGKLIEGSLDLLYGFYEMGYRWMQLTWAFPNQIASFYGPDEGPGLTDFGRELIGVLNHLGILIDVEHSGKQVFEQVMELSAQPILMSHGGAHGALQRSRHPEWNRGSYGCFLDDAMLKALAQKGGLLGIHFFGPVYFRNAESFCDITLADVLDHVQYVADLVGPDVLALGCDFFPTTGDWAELQRSQNSPPDHFVVRKQQLWRFTAELLRRGWPESDIQKVLGGNFLRVCRKVFGE